MDKWLWTARCTNTKCGKRFIVGLDDVLPGQDTVEHGAKMAKQRVAAQSVAYCTVCGQRNQLTELEVNRVTTRFGAGF